MNYLKTCRNYFTIILLIIIALLLLPCYTIIKYEEIYTYKTNITTLNTLYIDRFPDGTILMSDITLVKEFVYKGSGNFSWIFNNIGLLHPNDPNGAIQYINNLDQLCSTDSCYYKYLTPFKMDQILMIYINEINQYIVMIIDWFGNVISRDTMLKLSNKGIQYGNLLFVENTFDEDKYLFLISQGNYLSYIEYNFM